MRKRPERAGRISIQTLTISPMINVLNLVALAGFRPSPRGYKEEPEGAFYNHLSQSSWLREPDLNRRPSGYEPDELPGCSIPRP